MRKGFRKNYHKQFRRIIREANHMLAKDELFLGRFEVFIMLQSFCKFDDNSGGELTNIVRCYDKATGYYADYRIEYAPWMSSFYWHFNMDILNNFIVEKSNFWNERPMNSIFNAVDYTKVKVPVEYRDLEKHEYNFYMRAADKE